jgi:hypothetical protein
MSRFTTLDEEMLDKTKNKKILSRLVKKGGEEVKSLAQKVIDNAASSTKAKAGKPKSETAPESLPSKSSGGKSSEGAAFGGKTMEGKAVAGKVTSGPPLIKRLPEQVAGVKRLREAETSDGTSQKRAVVPTNLKATPSDLSKSKLVAKKIPAGTSDSKTKLTNNTGNSTVKTNSGTSKPVALDVFASLSSASKKPGTSNAALAAAAKQKARFVHYSFFHLRTQTNTFDLAWPKPANPLS